MQACPLLEFKSEAYSTAAACHPDGSALLAGYRDGSVRCFDLDTVAVRWAVAMHEAPIVAVVTDGAGNHVVAACRQGVLTMLDAATGAQTLHLNELRDELAGAELDALAVAPGGAQLAAAWGRGLAVIVAPWRQSPLRVIARFDAPVSEGPLPVRPLPLFTALLCCAVAETERAEAKLLRQCTNILVACRRVPRA